MLAYFSQSRVARGHDFQPELRIFEAPYLNVSSNWEKVPALSSVGVGSDHHIAFEKATQMIFIRPNWS